MATNPGFKAAKSLFKKYLKFEGDFGTKKTQEDVRKKAQAYVERYQAARKTGEEDEEDGGNMDLDGEDKE